MEQELEQMANELEWHFIEGATDPYRAGLLRAFTSRELRTIDAPRGVLNALVRADYLEPPVRKGRSLMWRSRVFTFGRSTGQLGVGCCGASPQSEFQF